MTEVIRSFWHGPPLHPYLLLCLHSFVARGHPVEVFTYERDHGFPSWIIARDAGEILPSETVMVYRQGPGAGSPALHANLFRMALLERLGGWWVDTDVALLAAELPSTALYFEAEEDNFTNSIIKFPRGHELLTEAVDYARKVGDNVPWATTGPTLLTAMIRKYELEARATPRLNGCPFGFRDVPKFFDPHHAEELAERTRSSFFMHLYNEVWRRFGIPTNMGPPVGSFLDRQFRQSGLDIHFQARIELRHLDVWITNAKAREHFNAYVENSRWSRLGRWLGLGAIPRDWKA
jgi:mannosyltransferase OCH1-like enzyme